MDTSTTGTEMGSMRGMEIMTRNSIHSLRPPSVVSNSISINSDANIWKLPALRKRFKNRNLEAFYDRYQQRLMHVDLKGFLLLQIFLSGVIIVLLLILNTGEKMSDAAPEIIAQGVLFVTACVFYSVAHREEPIKKYKYLHIFMAVSLAFLLVFVDLGLDLWFANQNKTQPTKGVIFHVPAALYTILAVYNLLPIASLRVTMFVGFFVGTVHVVASTLLFQQSEKLDVAMIVADVAFYIAANAVGIFTKCLNETTLRRAFLDRRRCIETTIKLEYEKKQEEQLMLSILPKHIAEEVGQDIREEVQLMMKREQTTTTERPFDKLHVERHRDVSVLYADIVNFTPMTATLTAGNLVSLLNELFGRFDEAARENNCLRIKILGDCYYCVSGIPDSISDHAKNCVKMGLDMIEIIRQVRDDRQVEVDMRIGVHSGSVISGLIGLRKWQFDIWGQDVTIANHMEQSGKPGRVHISEVTKDLLGDAYRYERASGNRDPYLLKLDIKTFLVLSKDANKNKDGEGKKIKFKADPFATLPRAISATTHNEGSPSFQRMTSEPASRPDRESNSSLESLYDKLPTVLPVMPSHSRNPTTSLPHIYMKIRRFSQLNGDENAEELYSRAYRSARRSSATSGTNRRLLAKRRSTTGENVNRRGAVLMDNTLVSFRQMMDQADSKMANAIESMRLSKFKSRSVPEQEQPVNALLMFSNRNWELPFLRRPDPLFNLYILGAIPVLAGIMAIQLSLNQHGPRSFWLVFGIALIVVILVGIGLWVPPMWRRNRTSVANDPEDILGSFSVGAEPNSNRSSTSTISAAVFKLDKILESLTARILIFLLVTIAVEACGLVDLDAIIGSNNPIDSNVTVIGQCEYKDPRIYLWYFTHICALTMTVAFGFYRIHFILKFAFYLAALITYTVLTNQVYPDICSVYLTREQCLLCSASPSVTPELSHAMYLFTILLVLHVADRQIEFIYRLDYVWQRQLVSEKDEANTTRMVNRMLLQNILPLHVAEFYLDTSRCSERLYHEEHKRVAVMFASIPNFMDEFCTNREAGDGDLHVLEDLNRIISAFDALSYEGPFIRIEKIKIVSSTYMAASGLTSARKGSTETVTESESCISSLTTMLNFALAMNTVLETQNKKLSRSFRLRTGIDYGPVIAGVVGAQKPLYDIWGDTVNMASRLESTGQLGEIQITEKTAKVLEAERFKCEKKGETFLKGKGYVTTYFVRPDATDIYETLGSVAGNRSLLGLSDMLLPASARNSISRPINRPSVLFEEDEEGCNTPIGTQSLPTVNLPRFSFQSIEEVETASQSTENIYSDATNEVEDEEDGTYL